MRRSLLLSAIYVCVVTSARAWKFRLGQDVFSRAGQDLVAAACAGILFWVAVAVLERLGASRRLANTVLVSLFSILLWVTLAGLIVVSVLSVPVTAALLVQVPDLMFVKTAIGVGTVATSLVKAGAVALVIPVFAAMALASVKQPDPARASVRMLAAGVAVLAIGAAVSITTHDSHSRDTNALVTLAESTVKHFLGRPPARVDLTRSEFLRRVCDLEKPSLNLIDLNGAAHERYDLVIYVFETGVAEVLMGEGSETLTPTLHTLAHRSLYLTRHLTTYPTSAKSIFSIITGRYPFPGATSISRVEPCVQEAGFVRALRTTGYRTSAWMSIDGHYERLSELLRCQGVDEIFDRDSLHLPPLEDPNFGRDDVMMDRLAGWFETGERPSAAIVFPSNSHWPFFFDVPIGKDRAGAWRYRSSVAQQDQILGRFVDALRESGRLQKTVLVVVPDHGGYFDLTGKPAFDDVESGRNVFHVPVVIDHPLLRERDHGIVVDRVTSHVDLGPTILDMLGLPHEPSGDGRSLFRPWPASRLVFFVDPIEGNLIGASNGSQIVRWDPESNGTRCFSWSGPFSTSETSCDADTKSIFTPRLDLFWRYEYTFWARYLQ